MKKVILQPIGNDNSIDNFKEKNSKRWAESTKYKKDWEESKEAIVLFTHDSVIFAKATISSIETSNHTKYPLNYYYDDIKFINIPFSKLRKITNFQDIYRNYTILNKSMSQKILDYFELLELKIYKKDEDYQKDIGEANLFDIKDESETPKEPKKGKNKSYYPRNKFRAKLALSSAAYTCEIDSNHTTFISKATNENYVEAHHIIPFNVQSEIDYNLDVTHNIVSLCPNCHKKIHLASFNDKKKMLDTLYNKHLEGLSIVHLDIGIDSLFSIYSE